MKTYSTDNDVIFATRVTKKIFLEFLQNIITLKSFGHYQASQKVMIALLVVNYFLSLTDLYNIKSSPSIEALFFSIYTALPDIKFEMRIEGDEALFQKYFVFSVINISTFFVFSILPLLILRIKNPQKVRKYVFGRFLAVNIFGLLLMLMALYLNEAGYESSRFPINPNLGGGAFFFLRDSGVFYVSTVAGTQIFALLRLWITKVFYSIFGDR